MRITWWASFTLDSGLMPVQSVAYWASRLKFPLEMTHSARPPVSSSRVATAWATRVGSRNAIGARLGPMRIWPVCDAAAANST